MISLFTLSVTRSFGPSEVGFAGRQTALHI
jgi:hypothetical protein